MDSTASSPVKRPRNQEEDNLDSENREEGSRRKKVKLEGGSSSQRKAGEWRWVLFRGEEERKETRVAGEEEEL